MDKQAYDQYVKVCQLLEQDPEYLDLEKKRLTREADFRMLLSELTHSQQEILIDYMGICAELQERILEIAYTL